VHPFNYAYCFENLLEAELLVGGVDRECLETDPSEALESILSGQQRLVLEKAEALLAGSDDREKARAERARILVRASRDFPALADRRGGILYPSDYRVRADALVEARRLVGGVSIEG
jgi:hypothetical protein